jgi:nematocidal protein AidA
MTNDDAAPGDPERRTIDIFVMIDTDLVAPAPEGSGTETDAVEDAKALTGIPHEQGYMIVSGTSGVTSQGGADVAFDALPGDTVRFFATSGSDNFDQAILVRAIRHAGGDEVLGGFELVVEPGDGVVPGSTESPLPAGSAAQTYWFWQCDVEGEGTESLSFVIALYVRNQKGKPVFAGFYRWDPKITVRFISTSTETST